MKTILFFAIFFTIVSGVVFAPKALAQGACPGDEFCLDTAAGKAELKMFEGSVPKAAGRFLGMALSLVGILFFILTIYGGILWMTARGNEKQEKKALQTLVSAIIGLLIILSSYVLINFVFSSLSGSGGGRADGGCTENSNCSAGEECIDNVCTSLCEIELGSRGYSCRDKSGCAENTINYNKCPGDNNNVCCLSKEEGEKLTNRCKEKKESPCTINTTQNSCISNMDCVWSTEQRCVWRKQCDFLTINECTNHKYCTLDEDASLLPGYLCCIYRLGLITDGAELVSTPSQCSSLCENHRAKTDCTINYVENSDDCR